MTQTQLAREINIMFEESQGIVPDILMFIDPRKGSEVNKHLKHDSYVKGLRKHYKRISHSLSGTSDFTQKFPVPKFDSYS